LGICDAPIDITPELDVVRCLALSSLARARLIDFGDENAIREWFRKNVDLHLLGGGSFESCKECEHFRVGRCQGGCLAWHMNGSTMGGAPPTRLLAERLYELMKHELPQSVLAEYENSTAWERTPLASFLAALAARK
jgi:cyclic pyranopterin phosphate synthase